METNKKTRKGKESTKKVEMFRELTMAEAEQIGELVTASLDVLNNGLGVSMLNLNAKVGSDDCVTNTSTTLRDAAVQVASIIGWSIKTKGE